MHYFVCGAVRNPKGFKVLNEKWLLLSCTNVTKKNLNDNKAIC